MNINTTGQALINTLIIYKNAIQNYSKDDFSYKESEDIWSLGQMYEHLVITANYFFLKNIKYCLEQKNGQIGGDKNEWGENVFKYNSFPPIKVKVPGGMPDPVAQDKENYPAQIDKIIEQINSQLINIEANNGEYKTQHPVFAWHNTKEWLASFEMHHRHHLRQKVELEGYLVAQPLTD